MDNFEAAIIKAASPSNRPPKDQPVAPSLGLILEEHFTPRYSPCARQRMWAVRNRQPISIMATAFNLLILLGGIRSLNAFAPLDVSSHHISVDSCAEPADHGSCRRTISARYGAVVEDPLLQRTGSFYYYAAHVTVAVWLLLDLWRYIGRDSAVLDYLLGFHSAARERARLRAFLLLLCCLAGASALAAMPRAPAHVQQQIAASRATNPRMVGNEVVRVEIELEQGEPIEKALRRFRKASNACGHLRILRNRKTFESAHDKKIRKTKESSMRLARARRSARSRAAAGF